jgi:membrane associated rhomboid family serine protease
MIIAPYNTDSPIYHPPIATVTIMVINVIVFFFTTLQLLLGNVELESIKWLTLEFDTINPLQWITNVFMHGDPFHLIGNMIFLWAFGLVVEGKIGALRFVALYLIIALLDGACTQLPMFLLGSDEFALGASGVIFALMVIAVIWAPENEMDCFYWFLFFFGTFEMRLVQLGGIYIFLQIASLFLSGFSMSSELLHMIGVMIGAPIGFYMLRQDMVDCEGWDLVSRNEFLQEYDWLCTEKQRQRMRSKQQSIEDPVTAALGYTIPLPSKSAGSSSVAVDVDEALPGASRQPSRLSKLRGLFEPERVKRRQREQAAATTSSPIRSHPDFNRLAFAFRQAVESQSTAVAIQTFLRMDQMKLAEGLGDQPLLRYVSLLGKQSKWMETLRPLGIVASHGGESADDARLRIAQVQLKVIGDPELALQTLSQIAAVTDRPSETEHKRMHVKSKLEAAAHQAMRRG